MDKPSILSRSNMINPAGISLFELLLTVSIVGILIALGVPGILESFKSQRVKGAIQSGYFMLQYARSVAISNGDDVAIDFESGSDWCIGISDSGPCDCNIANSCRVNDVEQRTGAGEFSNVQMKNLTFNGEATVIDGMRGMAAGNAGTLELSDGDYTLRLVMSNLARVRICSVTETQGNYPSC